ncbi:cobalt transporter CbiM [Rhodoferax sp.]|uniref:cobalt transporter CbiM n=1 Tax=Rhodoferax sp. TaxID=50421 RepID=UPI002848E212|nr:cobalt transporter CbiM [Rhodoferax sp.]MDR3368136.1 cobalt transporter CbiM [Rhodoferax sp.]
MHIPDGYLSPATCAVAYAVALPFWYVAFARVKRLLHTRTVPLLAVFSAFSFVIMMFNLPLPGGTTGHAVGVGIATIVLGPWASIVAVSIALLIQALFFGDGGITSFGANCLNMAVVGSLVTYWTYRLIAGTSELTSARRVIAAAAAGYIAINVSALFAAVEFGVQPMLFLDAGTPLYAPYPLSIAIPAMMIGHLTFAGLAELVVSGGLVAYLQRTNPDLLVASAPGVVQKLAATSVWKSTRALWYTLAGLMVLSPLGLLAAGTAWGEWGAEDFTNAEARQQMLQASANVAPPATVPQGLERLSSVWTPPFPDYAPSFMHNASFGYILSAVFGTGLILLAFLLISRLAFKKAQSESEAS